MKRILALLAFLSCFTAFAVAVISTPSNILNLLNWGDYIDDALIEKFEEEYHCQVVQDVVPSSEAMYQKISTNTSNYDVAIPGDYTVHQLYQEGYLQKIDISNQNLTHLSSYKTMFNDHLASIMKEYMVDENGNEFNSYYMPYFWGAYSILYSTNQESIVPVLSQNGFASFYNRSLFQSNVKIGMYSTARWIVASYLMSKGLNPNLTSYDGSTEGDLSIDLQNEIISSLKTASFDEFGNDQLKRDVANGALDFCFTQLGDFFDTLYLTYSQSDTTSVSFNVMVPKVTAAFFDSMVIPKTSKNPTLANQFIDFMLDPDNAYQNATVIGYSPTLKEVNTKFKEAAINGESYVEDENGNVKLSLEDFLTQYPMYLDPLEGTEKVYLFEPKNNAYITTCETIYNSLA